MKLTLSIALTLIFTLSIFAQQPNQWKGLTLDNSTAVQALEKFGSPKVDKINVLPVIHPKWVTKAIREKKWRVLHYENIEGFGDVKLGFDADDKLVLIHLEPKKLVAQALLSAYPDLEFRFADEVLSPADFKHPRNDEKTGKLGVFYVLIGLNEQAFIFTGIGNATGSVMSDMFGSAATRKSRRSVSGDVKILQLVSRKIENKDGVDLLK